MGSKKQLLLFLCFTCFLQKSDGQCQIGDNVLSNYEQQQRTIKDIFRGPIISSTTANIVAISSINYGGGLANSPSYLDITLVDSVFTVQTSSVFDQYEENETAMSIPVTINFACNGGTASILLLVINIDDTNNNYPEFIPRNEFEFVLAPPLPPGFLITGCLNEITVKDIDLTTSSIIFEIEENPYFQIEYDAEASNEAGSKMFKARLSTTTFIRTLQEPIALRITATDVDDTGDPPLSVSGMIRISGDTEFEFPEEPVFSQTFYFATYTDKHELILQETISLQQGFDDYVQFTLDGEYKNYFNPIPDGNQVSLIVSTPLPTDVMLEKQIYLIVRADREYTSGDTSTIVINLPEETPLLFESALYEGSIIDDALQLAPLVLSQGFEGSTVIARIVGEYSSSFTATVQGNLVTVTMNSLTNSIIGDNSFISIPVVASKDRSEATSIVTLEIIKDDNITPVFDESIYTGSYDNVDGLSLGEITILQGYDNTVTVELHGEHKDLFRINHIGTSIQLTSSTIPQELFEEQEITLRIEAAKPRTVGAKAAIVIKLPAPRKLAFEEPLYRGTIHNDDLWYQTILLSDGYDENVEITHTGEYMAYFKVTNEQNQVIITLPQALPESVITQNNNIALIITASGQNAFPTTISVLLDIIKEDATTPVLNQKIYQETYRGPTDFEIGNIVLTQGFDDNVKFKLDESEHAQYFEISNMDNLATIRLKSAIPVDVIFKEKFLLFNVIAEKPLTVGSHAAVIVRFAEELTEPTAMRFSENAFVGELENDQITFSQDIILSTGYVVGTNIELYGDLINYFGATLQGAMVIITLRSPIPEQSVPNNRIIILEIQASAPQSVTAHATLVVKYVDDVTPVVELIFAEPFYTGTYTDTDGLTFTTPISLIDGYDADVQFVLDGEYSQWFTLAGSGNSKELSLLSPIPPEVTQNNHQLIFVVEALRTGSTTTTATIVITLIDELIEPSEMRFSENFYVGALEQNEISFSNDIVIDTGYVIGTNVELYGDLKDYFGTTLQGAMVIVTLRSPIPEQFVPDNRIIVLEIQASAPQSVTAHATLVVKYVDDVTPVVELIFAEPFYTGTYTDADGLTFKTPISLIDGYDADVQFVLDGEYSQWFALVGSGNSKELSLLSPIPPEVTQNNHQLIFIVEAVKTGSTTTTATIVITLIDELIEPSEMRFSENFYVGALEQNEISFSNDIVIDTGYVIGTNVELYGDLKDYFGATLQGAMVIVTLRSPIPEQFVPDNRIIVLEIQASAPQSETAHATLVIEHILNDDGSPVVELIFAEPFYTGTYTDTDGLTFTTPISLTDGYDTDVQFVLNGEYSRWFTLVGSGNSKELSLLSPIPPEVTQNNHQLIFVVEALRTGSTTTTATIVITLIDEPIESSEMRFSEKFYVGALEQNEISFSNEIVIDTGYVIGTNVELYGDLKDYFGATLQGAMVIVTLRSPIPEQFIPDNRIIILEIQASAPQSVTAHATLVIDHVVNDDGSPVVELIFAEPFYTGTYTDTDGLTFTTPISLTDGYDADVQFVLDGEYSQWFALVGSGNSKELSLLSPIPPEVTQNNHQLIFVVEALRTGSITTTATIVITLLDEPIEPSEMRFSENFYVGALEQNEISFSNDIIIDTGYVIGTNVELYGGLQVTLHEDLKDYFGATLQEAMVIVTLRSPIPEQLIPDNRIIILEIQASAPQSVTAHATLVIDHVVNDDGSPVVELIFAEPFYTGTYTDTDGLTFTTPISLTDGYDADVQFVLDGEYSQWFALVGSGNSKELSLLSPIPPEVTQNNHQLIFVVEALRTGSTTTTATIVITLLDEPIEPSEMRFSENFYVGALEQNEISFSNDIIIDTGYVIGTNVELYGDLKDYFGATLQEAMVIVTLRSPIPEQFIPDNRIIILEIQASAPQSVTAHATLVIEHIVNDDGSPVVELIFAEPFYTGTYTDADGLTFTTPISLTAGYDADVQFTLNGDDSQWFTLVGSENSQVLSLLNPIPAAVLHTHQQLVFVVEALKPGSTTTTALIVINLLDAQTESKESFEKVLYEGVIRNGVVFHETIRVTEFDGKLVKLDGVHSSLFEAEYNENNGEVTVRAAGSLTLPAHITHLPLELRAGSAEAVLLLDISQSGVSTPVVVTFSSSSYAIRVENTVTGAVGQVQATADNGEAVRYSLQLDNVHLQERLSIDDDGTLWLSDPVNSGIYTFQIVATTIYTDEMGTATVFLTSEAIAACGDDNVMPPLIVLDRDEEEDHYNLFSSNEGCHFSLTNRWPLDQTWVYVDETGLHTRAIDREHQSIAFMTLSQVQVEITQHCDSDETRVKRSLTYDSDPYEYGSNNWILVDTIPYNKLSRRSLVNLIVNDINDNVPIFVDKEREPIAVGYPVAGLEEIVLPRSLAELKATDADIGENAALVYSSSEPVLAVSPSTGFVHIRDGAKLENNARLTVNATDLNGQGLTGSIDIVVKLLDESNILVVTVRDEFLNNEVDVLTRLSQSLGYELKVLRSVVISEDEIDEEATRKKRDIPSATGASLQLYVYGLIDREPVSVERLITDITNAEVAQVNIASTVSLEDHLAGQEICVILGRDTGLLAATIVLSVLLFIVLVLIAVWFFLRWRRNRSYGRFSDTDSFTSQNEPKPVEVVLAPNPKPRLNIEELKKSERRLQEMLDAPIEEVTVEPTSSRKDAVVDMPSSFAEPNSPIIIQSMDKLKAPSDDISEDEFGEIKNTKPKSVVTFNENVEKIIHVEDNDVAEANPSTGFEIYKL